MSYGRLVRFVLPLAITAVVLELGSQVLNGGMARVPRATQTLAAFGLSWGLVLFFSSPLGQAKELGLVLVDGPASLQKLRRFVWMVGAVLMAALATLTLTPVGTWVIEDLHGVDPELGGVVRIALLWMIPYPLLRGMTLFHAGLLLRAQRTALVSYAMLANLSVSILAVFVLLPTPIVLNEPILLPVLAVYSGSLVELSIILWAVRHHTGEVTAQRVFANSTSVPSLSFGYIVRFFWPLALIMVIQEFSRPMINLFIANGPNATEALAVLAVLYTLGRIPYGWLNEIRNLPTAFQDADQSMVYIRGFAIGCVLVSFAIMVVMFWTPLRDYILETLIGLEPHLAAQAHVPLYIFSFFSFVVGVRAYFQGIGLFERRTRALAPSAPARLMAIFVMLVTLSAFGISGATLGTAALFSGFVAEAAVVWWGVRGRQIVLGRREDVQWRDAAQ